MIPDKNCPPQIEAYEQFTMIPLSRCLFVFIFVFLFRVPERLSAKDLKPIPDRLVVLTFDDGNLSDYTLVAPLLQKHGFGATFFVTANMTHQGIPGEDQSRMTWQQIHELHQVGFEIGNHSTSHPNLLSLSREKLLAEVEQMEVTCLKNGISRPMTFCYPGYHNSPEVVTLLAKKGYLFARRGVAPEYFYSDKGDRGPVYDPQVDHPLLIPTTGSSGPAWDFNDFLWAVKQARNGKIAVLTFHGVPDVYPHCSTTEAQFTRYVEYLHQNNYTVIALRDLAQYVDPTHAPPDPYRLIYQRLGLTPVELKCEYSTDPLGIDTARPRFSWQLRSTRRDQKQAAYQILVATSRKKLADHIGDLWDSGKVESAKSVHIVYDGLPLVDGQSCYWKVRCWNKPGYDGKYARKNFFDGETVKQLGQQHASVYSNPASFTMGLQNEQNWQGQWIAADKKVSSPLLRREFQIDRDVKRAQIHLCGLGFYELFINGKKVGNHVLDPASTYFENDRDFKLKSRALYTTYDVSAQLRSGANAVGVMLGHGWYSAEADIPPSPSHRDPYGNRPVLLLQMNIEFQDGSRISVVSDRRWKTATGPITYNDPIHGETYDARLETAGWNEPGFDADTWTSAQLVDGPKGTLHSQLMPASQVVQTLQPVSVSEVNKGVFVYDFGQNFSGWTRFRVQGHRGTKVVLQHGAQIHDDGSLDARSNLHPRHVARQRDTYILKGDTEEVWEPRFTLHGFRYVAMTGYPGTPTLANLEGRHVRNAVPQTGHFACSNDLINRVHSNVHWTLASSLQGFPQDAADRSERVGWTGDVMAEDYNHNFYMPGFWAKWLADLNDAQKQDGDLPLICPGHWRGFYGWMPVWKSVYPLTVWQQYLFYEDQRTLANHYDGIKKLVELFNQRADNHILRHGLGDHMEPDPSGITNEAPKLTSATFTSTAYYYYDTWILAQAAKILGRQDEHKHYVALAEQIKQAFNDEFFDPQTYQYAGGSQTANSIALWLEMVPETHVDKVTANLVKDIREKHDRHLSTGFLGVNGLAQTMAKHRAAELLYDVVCQTDFPGWGYMISKGATTVWETWDGNPEEQMSRNMKLHCGIDKFFYRDLAGLQLAAPGFKEIVVRPQVIGDLTFAEASIQTPRGPAEVRWQRTDQSFELTTTIPVNSTARVYLPKLGLKKIVVSESGMECWKAGDFIQGPAGITTGTAVGPWIVLHVGSGRYDFRLSRP